MAFTVADYVLTRLREQHVDTLFGVPAAYCSQLYDAAGPNRMTTVVTSSDLEAGYAADGYARTRGLGAVAVAYGVGTLSMVNAIAGAYVERSPVVVVNGGPTHRNLVNLRDFDVLFSHSTGRRDTDLKAYELVTASAARAGKVSDVPSVVDQAVATAVTKQRPVYVEISKDLWTAACPAPTAPIPLGRPAAGTEAELARTIVQLLRAARSPLVLIGTEVQRYGLADQVATLVARLGTRWATALLAKSTLPETGKGWVGVYDPPHSLPAVAQAVEQADLLLMLGCVFPNGYAPLVTGRTAHIVSAYDGSVRLKGGTKQRAEIGALVKALVSEAGKGSPRASSEEPVADHPGPAAAPTEEPATASGALTYRQVLQRVGAALDDTLLAIPDTFLGVFAAANLPVRGRDGFLCSGVWASIGHSVAAAVGAALGSRRRPLVVCGDGGFQMTAQALSTMARYRLAPVVVVVDNGIYGYEQLLVDGAYFRDPAARPRPYVVLHRWDLVGLARALGVRAATSVDTAAELDAALAAAKAAPEPALIAARVDPHGLPT